MTYQSIYQPSTCRYNPLVIFQHQSWCGFILVGKISTRESWQFSDMILTSSLFGLGSHFVISWLCLSLYLRLEIKVWGNLVLFSNPLPL